jgi:DNA-binding NtrC family response regulator
MADVLVVDDEVGMRVALDASFRRSGWRVRTAAGKNEALALFRSAPCPLVVTDMRMPDGDGLAVMQGIRAMAPQTAVIFLTAFGNVPEAVTAMKEGACDYLIKPVSFEHLRDAAERILGGREVKSDPAEARLVGSSPRFRALIELARRAAKTNADILVEAESGTGKEVLARFIHNASQRHEGAFVAVNCAAFPEALLESELFGHVRGAFTGATASKPGKFELANGGTLLLDEISEMPLSLQPKLLRVLQEREVDRLGDTRPVRVDVRVIATTNCCLRDAVQQGAFRADLYYRLNVIPLALPPLRERREDIPELAEHFVRQYSSRSGGQGVKLSAELMERLQEQEWPGNVRELENFIRRALALSSKPIVDTEVLSGSEFSPEVRVASNPVEPGLTLRELERQLVERTLEATGGNRTRAADMLGVSLRTVRNKIREYGLGPRRVV